VQAVVTSWSIKNEKVLSQVEKMWTKPQHSNVSKAVLVNWVYCTPQGVPEFSRGVSPWWGVQGCTRCVLLKNNHISHIKFLALHQFVYFAQFLKPYLSECEFLNCPSFLDSLFVILVRWPSRDHVSFYVQRSRGSSTGREWRKTLL